MHMTAIQAETERNRLDRSARCAEKRRRRAGMLRVCGPIRPTWEVRATTDASWGGKRLIRWRSQAIFTSEGRPLGECRLKGHGGSKAAVRRTYRALGDHRYVYRTDVKSYYASIDHHKLMDQLARYIADRQALHLWQYMRWTVEYGGTFREITRGIPAGCSLSPLIGAFHLQGLDEEMTTRHARCFYIRYMDDILVLAPSRWHLRRAIACVRHHLDALGLEPHPDKTSIGPIARGFDFLGYQFDPTGLRLSEVALQCHQEKLTQLYERYQRQLRAYRKRLVGQSTIPRPEKDPARAYLYPRPQITSREDIVQRLEAYKRRFNAWAQGGLASCGNG